MEFKPDLENYLSRLELMQQDAVPEASFTRDPYATPSTFPSFQSISTNVEREDNAAGLVSLRFNVDFLLLRGYARSGYAGDLISHLLQDQMDVLFTFEGNRNMIIGDFAEVQNGYKPRSLALVVGGQIQVFRGENPRTPLVGSRYKVTWVHRIMTS